MIDPDRFLSALDVRVKAFSICEVFRGWRLTFEPHNTPTAHYGLSGSGVIRLANGSSIPIAQDTLAILPSRIAHSFEPQEEVTGETFARSHSWISGGTVPRIQAGSGESCIMTACGNLYASYGGAIGYVDGLKEPIIENFAGVEWLRGASQALLVELESPAVGTRALVETLLKQCLVLLLRRRTAENGAVVPWLPGLQDSRLAPVIAVMLEHPGEEFTLESLAEIAGMSKSAFTSHFSAAVGKSPMEFLKQVRLGHAARLLETTNLPIKVVAKSVGYISRSYFSRSFRKLYGVDPTSFRSDRQLLGMQNT